MGGRCEWVVCFDLGGVIVRIARDWAEGCRAAGVEERAPALFHDAELKAERRGLSSAYQSGAIGSEAFFAGVAAQTGGLYTAGEVERVHDAWIYGEYAGVAALVERLNGVEGVVTACLSNTNEAHWLKKLAGDGVGSSPSEAVGLMRHRMASFEMGCLKPDEAIYAEAERQLRAVAGVGDVSRVVFFDDLEANVEAARARGWNAHLVDHAGDTAGAMAARLVSLGVLV